MPRAEDLYRVVGTGHFLKESTMFRFNIKKLLIAGLVLIIIQIPVNIYPAIAKADTYPPTSGVATMVMYYPPTVHDSYSDISINGGDLLPGWCADKYVYIVPNIEYQVILIDYFGYPPITTFPPPGTYPPYIESIRWDYIAYILNHKQGTGNDVQQAFWYFSDGLTPTSPAATAMVNDTLANGNGFIPGPGQIRPIICDLGSNTQRTFFELQNPEEIPPKTDGEKPEDICVGIEVFQVDKLVLILPALVSTGLFITVISLGLLLKSYINSLNQ